MENEMNSRVTNTTSRRNKRKSDCKKITNL